MNVSQCFTLLLGERTAFELKVYAVVCSYSFNFHLLSLLFTVRLVIHGLLTGNPCRATDLIVNWHILKPKTKKRNEQNETSKTSKTTVTSKTKRTKQPEQAKRIE